MPVAIIRTLTALIASFSVLVAFAHEPEPDDAHRGPANRLADASSPYLLQHAYNPVDWYPWGDEAIQRARSENKLIFLSIGYSTCYWCHVMERESFENPEVAAIMNERFVCIKVDREERPDIDTVYMAGVYAVAGRGGWPISLFLEPDTLKPIGGGTYFGPRPSGNRKSFPQLMDEVETAWRDQPAETRVKANDVGRRMRMRLTTTARVKEVNEDLVDRTVSSLLGAFDEIDGGFGSGRTKFPMPGQLDLMLAVGADDRAARDAALFTLDRMATGGIYDQVGGGFHRYSTDRQWRIPHFEKMLYDNAQLASTYARSYELTGDAYHARICRETLEYILREMTSDDGAFYSAQDAEVNAREGQSYLWTREQMKVVLTNAGFASAFAFARQVYSMDGQPTFRDPHHPKDTPSYVLYLPARPDEIAAALDYEQDVYDDRIARVRAVLLAARDQRDQPLTDDKIIAGWNGLMIRGFVDGARALDEPRYLDAARAAAEFILTRMLDDDSGTLYRTMRDGRRGPAAFLIDYALVTRGLLALHVAIGDDRYLDAARRLVEIADARFRATSGAYHDTRADQTDLFIRAITTRDGVIPSGNAIMLLNHLELLDITGDARHGDDASRTLRGLSGRIAGSPTSSTVAIAALYRALQDHPEVAHAASPNPQPPAVPPSRVVEITAAREMIRLKRDEPVTLTVTLDCSPPYHLNANPASAPNLVATEISLVDGTGIDVSVDYPRTEMLRPDLAVYQGRVEVIVTLTQRDTVTGRPRLMVVYQPCTEDACLASAGKVLPVLIIPASE